MNLSHTFTCYLIGEDSLLIQCAEILHAQHHRILGIISPLPSIKKWALEQEIPHFDTLEAAETTVANTPFDYWFSIINSRVLPPELLNRCQAFAVNLHDSPLPRLAGVNATCWAILQNETQHAITWHIINDVIDGGDILKQSQFDIDADETAFSLNLKCYQHAVAAFAELVEDLVNQTYQRQPQNLSARTYYGMHQKPPGNGWIAWHDSAEAIERLCRAVHFGDYRNRFSVAKFSLGDAVFVLDQCQVGERSNQLPGTLISLFHHRWEVATSTHNLILLQISTLEGKPCDFATLAQRYQLVSGQRMPSPTVREREQLQHASATLGRHEGFWRDQLLTFEAATLPFLPDMPSREGDHMSKKKSDGCLMRLELH